MTIAASINASLCALMKSWLRFWNSNQRFALLQHTTLTFSISCEH